MHSTEMGFWLQREENNVGMAWEETEGRVIAQEVVVVWNEKGSSQEVSEDKDDSKERWKGAEMMGKKAWEIDWHQYNYSHVMGFLSRLEVIRKATLI